MLFVGPALIFLLLAAPAARLLRLAWRTRELPEFWGGIYFAGASIGIAGRVLGSSIYPDDPILGDWINIVGHVAFALGTIAMALFTFIVFRRASAPACMLAIFMISAIVATSAHALLGGHASLESSISIIATNFARLLPTTWAFYEAFRFWRAMRRREALGLADPIVTNRFGLWSIWTGAVTLMPMVPLTLRLLGMLTVATGSISADERALWVAPAVVGLRVLFIVVTGVAAVALSLSFFPPSSYLDRVRRRSADTRPPVPA